jgi:cellulose synthase/poly-beta-1,6-N-acetylglucosamine synthase-like glycosyltransferase
MHRLARPARGFAIAALVGIASFGHVLYPAWLGFKTRAKRDPEPPSPETWPGLTVLVPAYRERKVIKSKVEDAFANGYPGPLQVLVVADDPQTARAASSTEADVIVSDGRQGKASAVNRGLEQAQHEIVVLTDANASLASGTLAALARWFEDPSVGAVAGEKRVLDQSEALYWKFESWLKRRESRLGTTIGLVGELAALRRAAVTPVPPDLIVDDLWLAIELTSAGHRIVYDASAVATENGSASLADEWERRTRNVAGALDAIWRQKHLLARGGSPLTPQLWGHRLVRLAFGPAAHLSLLAVALASARRSRPAALFCLGHAVAAAALLRKQRAAQLSPPERLLAQVLFLQAVGLRGTLRWLAGDHASTWRKKERADVLPDGSDG